MKKSSNSTPWKWTPVVSVRLLVKIDADLVALVDADRRARASACCSRARRPVGFISSIGLLDLVDREPEDLDAVHLLERERAEDVGQDQLRHLDEGRLLLELRVRLGRPEDLDQLGERLGPVDALERGREVAHEPPDDVPRGDVVVGPAGRDASGSPMPTVRPRVRRTGRRMRPRSGRRSGAAVAAPGVAGAPKLQVGEAAAWHAATLAATPAMPVRPAARRNPRRVSADAARPRGSAASSDAVSTGWSVTVGSTGTGSPVQGGRMDWGMVGASPMTR